MKNQIERAEPSRGAPDALTAAEFWPGWADRNPIENWDEEVTEASVAIEFAEDYAEKLRAGHVVLLEALKLMVDWFGAAHEEACSKDDTCHCEGRPINDAVNAAIRSTQPTQPQIGLLKNTMQPWIKKVYAALEADEAEAAIQQAERT